MSPFCVQGKEDAHSTVLGRGEWNATSVVPGKAGSVAPSLRDGCLGSNEVSPQSAGISRGSLRSTPATRSSGTPDLGLLKMSPGPSHDSRRASPGEHGGHLPAKLAEPLFLT
jgi:hypothetical protein